MGVERTFWEKVTILHQLANLPEGKPFPERHSRHYCDVAAMIAAGTGAAGARDEKLLEAVVAHKKTFFRSNWAQYHEARHGTLKLLPPEHLLTDLERDLTAMTEMFFDGAPELPDILDVLREWQDGFNS